MMRYAPAFCALLLSTSACDKQDSSSHDEKPEAASKTTDSRSANKGAAPLIVGSVPTLPAALKGVGPGTKLVEAKQKLPGLDNNRLRLDEYPKTSFWLYTPKGRDHIRMIKISLPASAGETVTKAWGEPVMLEDLGKQIPAWMNPEAKLMAKLKPGFGGDKVDLVFTRYIPYKSFVGDSGADIAFQAKHPLLGSGIEDLRKNYPESLEEVSQAQASAQRARIKKMVGKKANLLGKARPSAHLDFPPTEYGSQFTRVNFFFDKEGKVQSFRFDVSYRAKPGEKDAMKEFFSKKFGEPKTVKYLNRAALKWGSKPATYLIDSKITKAWTVEVTAKPRY